MTRRLSPTTVFFLMHGVAGLFFAAMNTVSGVYRVAVVELNPLQLVLVGTTLEVAYFLTEVPTGVVADAYSRKLSLIIGYLMIGVGFVVEGLVPAFWAVLLSQVIWGVGITFLSGASTAWLAGEIGEERLTAVSIRGGQIGSATAIGGTLLGMGVGSYNLGLVFIIAGIGLALLGLALIRLMPETNFVPAAADERTTWGKLGYTLRAGSRFVRASALLQVLFAIEMSYGLTSEGIDRLSEAHLLQSFAWPTWPNFAPVVWLGAFGIVNSLIYIGVGELLRRYVPEDDGRRTLRVVRLLNSGYMLSVLAFALAGNLLLGFLAYGMLLQMRGGAETLFGPYVAKQVAPNVRATVLSMWGQMNAIGQIIGGPLIGVVATLTTLRIGYASIALLLLPVPLLLTRILRRPALLALAPAEPIVDHAEKLS